jgi:hypothetical protein
VLIAVASIAWVTMMVESAVRQAGTGRPRATPPLLSLMGADLACTPLPCTRISTPASGPRSTPHVAADSVAAQGWRDADRSAAMPPWREPSNHGRPPSGMRRKAQGNLWRMARWKRGRIASTLLPRVLLPRCHPLDEAHPPGASGGCPRGRDFHAQNRANPRRCRPITVAGWTIASVSAHGDQIDETTTQNARSMGRSRGRGVCATENRKLLAEREVLGDQARPRPQGLPAKRQRRPQGALASRRGSRGHLIGVTGESLRTARYAGPGLR